MRLHLQATCARPPVPTAGGPLRGAGRQGMHAGLRPLVASGLQSAQDTAWVPATSSPPGSAAPLTSAPGHGRATFTSITTLRPSRAGPRTWPPPQAEPCSLPLPSAGWSLLGPNLELRAVSILAQAPAHCPRPWSHVGPAGFSTPSPGQRTSASGAGSGQHTSQLGAGAHAAREPTSGTWGMAGPAVGCRGRGAWAGSTLGTQVQRLNRPPPQPRQSGQAKGAPWGRKGPWVG